MTWLAGLRTLEDHIVPGVRKAAAAAGRPQPRVVAAVQVAVCDDADAARDTAEVVFARYGGLENYQRLLEHEGVASPGALAVVGTESEVEKQLRRYAGVGATELWPTVFAVGKDADVSVRRTRALLAELAPCSDPSPSHAPHARAETQGVARCFPLRRRPLGRPKTACGGRELPRFTTQRWIVPRQPLERSTRAGRWVVNSSLSSTATGSRECDGAPPEVSPREGSDWRLAPGRWPTLPASCPHR